MLTLFLLLWVLIELSAPIWCFVVLGFAFFIKCIAGLIELCKSAVDLTNMGKTNKSIKKNN